MIYFLKNVKNRLFIGEEIFYFWYLELKKTRHQYFFNFYFPHLHSPTQTVRKSIIFVKKFCLSVSVISQKVPIGFSWNLDCRCINVAWWLSSNLEPNQKQGCHKLTKISVFDCCFIVIVSKKHPKDHFKWGLLHLKQKIMNTGLPDFYFLRYFDF